MNCMIESKENYKCDLGVKGLRQALLYSEQVPS